jgi:hypothetical protein
LAAGVNVVAENLCRADLSPAERAKQTARRKEIYEELHPETKYENRNKTDAANFATSTVDRFLSNTAATTRVANFATLSASRRTPLPLSARASASSSSTPSAATKSARKAFSR